jgi:hypothetical protein
MAGGLLLGSGFGAVLIGFDSNLKSTLLLLSFPLSGAFCGWIYWRIALGPKARETAGAS